MTVMTRARNLRAKSAALALLLVLCLVPGIMADGYVGGVPPVTVQSGTVSGGLYVDADLPSWGSLDVTKTFSPIPAVQDIPWARLYVAVYCGHMQNNYNGTATVSFDGDGDGTFETILGTEDLEVAYVFVEDGGTTPVVVNDHCNRVTSDYLMWYDVTSLITSTTPKARVETSPIHGSFDGRIKMITLVVAYNDGSAGQVHYWVNQGHDIDSYYADGAGMPYTGQSIFDLSGVSGTVGSAALTVNHLASTDGSYAWSGDPIPADPSGATNPPGSSWQGAFFGYNIWDLTDLIEFGDEYDLTYDRTDQFYKIPLVTLAVSEASPVSDLAVTFVNPDTGNVFALEENRVRINIRNNGPDASPETEVRLTSTDGLDVRGPVHAIDPGATIPVFLIDPTIRPNEGGAVTYTAFVDPDNTLVEPNEANNSLDSTPKPVKFNGYKGKRYWEGKSDVTTKRTFDLRGGLLYSAGDSVYLPGGVGGGGWSSSTVTWTGSDLALPAGATVREARLYVPYTWDDAGQIPDHFSLTFNGSGVTHEYHYTDKSNFGGYANHVYGLLTYNVTGQFSPSGNSAVLTKDDANTNAALYGLTLAVVYEDPTATRKQIFLNEEFDLLGADATMYATTPEEATAYIPFSGMVVAPGEVSGAVLTTFVPSGNGPEGDLLFNGDTRATMVWDYGSTDGTQVAVDSRDVTAYLQASGNEAGIRSTQGATPAMAASHAFFVIDYADTPPVAQFTANTTSGTAPLSVQFTDQSTGTVTTYAWDFTNDGIVDSTAKNASFTYSSAGTYTVNLTVTGPGGADSEVKAGYITVTAAPVAPVAAFSATPLVGVAPLSVTFTDESANNPTGWSWEYNAGTGWVGFSTQQNPVQVFHAAGPYDIRLTVNNAAGSDTETRLHDIAVATGIEPIVNSGSGTVTGDLFFESPLVWPATEVTPAFTLPAAAVGNIEWARLYVTTYSGSAQNTYALTSTVTLDGTILGVETMDIASETNGNSYPLNDHVTKVYSDYEAQYDVTGLITSASPVVNVKSEAIDGKNFDGRIKAVTLVVAYDDPSSATETRYWVNHGHHWANPMDGQTIFDTTGLPAGWVSAESGIRVLSAGDAAYSFNGNPKAGQAGNNWNYDTLNTWDVTGDITPGASSTLAYARSGAYKATLATLKVSYAGAPAAGFSVNTTSGAAPLPVRFTDESTGDISDWSWVFGDGGTSSEKNPAHTYTTPGTYTVNLTVTGPGGSDSAVETDFITVTGTDLPDLVITQITPNGNELFAHESNTINATVRNNGTAAAGPFSVRIDAAGSLYDAALSGLAAGAQQEVQVTDTTLRTAGDSVTITATADPDLAVAESNETNNALSITKTVMSNGYKGKRWTDGNDIETVATFEGRVGMAYSTGDAAYRAAGWTGATTNWTASDLPIPGTATILLARLYQGYTFDQTPGGTPVWTMTFNGQQVTPDALYTDRKGYGSFNYPSGLYAYTVTDLFSMTGNAASVTPGAGNNNGLYGSYLLVIYEDENEPVRKIWINEECDLLYSGTTRFVSDEEATSSAPFAGAGVDGLDEARVLAILFSANEAGKSVFIFNGQDYGDLSPGFLAGPQVTLSEFDVTGSVVSGENSALFRSVMVGASGDNMVAAGAVLITEYAEDAPVAAFTADPTSGTAPLPVQFTDGSTGTITSRTWDFGDGFTSYDQNPVHTYVDPGTYSVNLTVTGPGGSDSEVKTGYITIPVQPVPPGAGFTADPTDGTAPLPVQFTDESTGTISSWTWNFGDGFTSHDQNPSHTYTVPGTYTVNLTVTGPGGSDSEVKTGYITVTAPPGEIVADFVAAPLSGSRPLLVRYTDQSTGLITAWAWDFNNDGRVDSTLQNPTHAYFLPGSYTVRLTVSGPDGTDEEVRKGYITVTEPAKRPFARFTQDNRFGVAPLTVQFTDRSMNSPDTYLWSFGDGTTSSEMNPEHTFGLPGLYRVSLTVSNDAGSGSTSGYVVVRRPWGFF